MKFTCSKKELVEALNAATHAVAVKPQMPIQSGIYLKADGSTLELQANNFSLGIVAKIPVNTEEPGEIVVVGKFFQEIVKKLSGDTVTISYQSGESVVSIQSESAAFTLLAMNADDFPKVKSQDVLNSFKIKTSTFKNLIRKTSFSCASNDDARPIFTGCCLEINGNSVTMAATNAHRLAVMKETVPENLGEMKFIIPAVTLKDLARTADSSAPDSFVTVDCSAKNIAFTFDNVFMTSRLIEGQFPPYDRVIPPSSEIFATIKVAEFAAAVERVSIISKETEHNTIRFIFSNNGIDISSTSPEVGKVVEHVDAQIDGGELDISFNVQYISEILKVLDSETCRFAMTKPLAPVDVRETDNDNFIYIVTPVRTSN
ncbi:MAG: DNA polymerase III subunit beta [Selenomonadaceae bacterium]|nr:DNA polymerase III subunit beta [Selenomonadaceae bacterium]